MACNTEYSTGGSATSVTVNNYYGESIAATAGENMAWNAVGDAAGVTFQWFEQDSGIAPGGGYSSQYKKKKEYYQSCSAIAKMFETKGGEAVDENLNSRYWTAQEGLAASIESGFRTWSNGSSSTVEKAAHTAAISYSLFDFGIEKPTETEIETVDDDVEADENEEEPREAEISGADLDALIDGSGAYFLKTAGLAMAATALMF